MPKEFLQPKGKLYNKNRDVKDEIKAPEDVSNGANIKDNCLVSYILFFELI